MKKINYWLFIILVAIFSSCREDQPDPDPIIEQFPAENDREFDNGSGIDLIELNERLTEDLALLGRIWGGLKYHHPEVGKGNYNWDYELFRILPTYVQVKSTEERDRIISGWINKYGEIRACTTCRETPNNALIKPDLLWAENSNMNNALKAKIREIYQNRNQGEHFYIRIDETVGHPEFLHEYPYSNKIFPDAGFRLLALYRYWNMIHYFFPYKYLTDKNWDDILTEYVPMLIAAENRLEYELAITQIIAETNDTHATFINGRSRLEELKGNKYPPFQVRFIEGKLVVTLYYKPELKETSGLEIGDVITHINGETVESIVANLKKYYPASNEVSSLLYMSSDLLRSDQNTITVHYNSMGKSGQKEIQLYDRFILNIPSVTDSWVTVDKNKAYFRILDENIGYVTLASIRNEDVATIKESFKNTKGIIVDIRNYPSSIEASRSLGSYFVRTYQAFAYHFGGKSDNPGEFSYLWRPYISYDGSKYFEGKLIVLINEITLSNAEYAAMCFRSGLNTYIIGSTTAGSVGRNPTIVLPGGITTTMTGLGTRCTDGTETQRVGIIPDIWVEPTIEGIREGRDELLEMAINLINEDSFIPNPLP